MTKQDFEKTFKSLETLYDKELGLEQKMEYYNIFKSLDIKQFNMIVTTAKTRCKFFPKPADLQQILKDTRIVVDKPVQKVDCNICKGKGFILYKKETEYGLKYDYVARCTCINGNEYISFPSIERVNVR